VKPNSLPKDIIITTNANENGPFGSKYFIFPRN